MKFDTSPGWVLFDSFDVQTGGQFFCALLLILLLSVLTEGLSFAMWYTKFSTQKNAAGDKNTVIPKLIEAIFFFLLRLLNYCQMLVAMTYNFWLITAIAVCQFLAWFAFTDIKDGLVIKKALLVK